MECKTFEIRDVGTFIPVLATKLAPSNPADAFLFARAGFGRTPDAYVMLARLVGGGGECQSDPYEWGQNRTFFFAHKHIIENWEKLPSGSVVDVEFILGVTKAPKATEALDFF